MTKTIQNGGFTNPAGGLLTGNLLLVLSQDAKVAAAPNQVAPIATRIPISAGNIAPTLIYFNDELLPGNTTYTATAYDAAGNKTYGPEIVSLTGAGPLDLGTLVPLLISPDPLFSNPVLQNPALPQTITGQLTVLGMKSLNSIQFADQFTAGTLALPTLGPGLNNLSSGGSVAANTYACQVTFQGTSGETTASPASPTTTTSGATSVLQCQPLDIPSGALSYNVYWQTGGAGSFFLGHTAVALGTSDSQITTPPISGTIPPISNTAVSVIAAAQSALSSGAGTVFIPSTLTSAAGVSGSLLTNQSMFDFRNGVISSRPSFPGNCATKNFGSAPACNAVAYDILAPVQLGTLYQANGMSAIMHAQNVATYWGGPSASTGMVAGLFGTIRDGTRTENIWGADIGANCSNVLGQCTGLELDIQLFGGVTSDSQNGGVGLLILPGGNTRVFEGIRMSAASPGAQMKIGMDIQPNLYTVNGIAVGGSSNAGSIGIVSFNSNTTNSTGGAFLGQASSINQNVYMLDNAALNQSTCINWRNAGTSVWTACQDASGNANWAFTDIAQGIQRVQWNSGANGANIYNTPGAGVHAFNNLIRWTEQAAPATPGAGFDGCYGDSTLHALKCSYNNGAFLQVPQVIASGTSAMGTGAIAATTCAAAVTTTATGTATTDAISWAFNAAPPSGYAGASPAAGLAILAYVTSGSVNFQVCNPTAASITPAAATLNWRVVR